MTTSSISTTSLFTKPGADPSVFQDAGLLPSVATPAYNASAGILTVGVGKEFSTLSAAIAASKNGSVILVDAGTYTNDFATIYNKISIIGVGGMVNLVATESPPNLKGILTVDNDVTIENVSFSGCAIDAADGGNGAGIRYEGGIMVLENDSFFNNQDGILAAAVTPGLTVNTITIDHCLFSGNGSGTGYTHNIYVSSNVQSLTFTNNISQDANVGHELKSRAQANTITGNIFRDGPTGDASYEIDLPNGGADVIENNVIEKGPNAPNNFMVHFGGEGIPYAGSFLTVENNSFINDQGPNAVAILNQTAIAATISDNTFTNIPAANIATGPAIETGNTTGSGAALANNTITSVLPGSTIVFTDSAAHSVTLDGNPYLAVEGGAGYLTARAIAGHVVAIGGSGGMMFIEASATSGGNQITTAAGSTNYIVVGGQDLIDSEGSDTIVTGFNNVTASINGSAIITDGANYNVYTVKGVATIAANNGSPIVNVQAGGQATISGPLTYLELSNNGGSASFNITQGGAQEVMSITGGSADIRVYGGQMNVVTAAGSNGTTLRFGAGAALVSSVGTDTIYAGSGVETVIVSGAASIYAGTGTLSVFGRSDQSGATIYGAGGTVTLDGDTGNLTYYGGAKSGTVINKLSNDTLIGGTGLMTVVGGSRETITGGSGGLIYTSADGGGANLITTAAGSTNSLQLAASDTIYSYGNDTIMGGSGNSIFVLNGNAVLNGSSGSSNVTINGKATLIGKGVDQVTVNAGAQATIMAGQAEYINETNGTVSLTVGAGPTSAKVTVSGGTAAIAGVTGAPINIDTIGQGSVTVTAGAGTVNVLSRNADQLHAGSGSDTFTLTAANATIWGGSGALTVNNADWNLGDQVTIYGGTGSLSYAQGQATLNFVGGSGSSVINGGSGSLFITGGAGKLTVTGGSGGLHFTGGSGAASINLTPSGGVIAFGVGALTAQEAGWGASVEYDIVKTLHGPSGVKDIINGFRVGVDHLILQGGETLTSTTVSGGSANLKFSDGTLLQLTGVTRTTGLIG